MAIATENEIYTRNANLAPLFAEGKRRAAKLGRAVLVSHTEEIESLDPVEFFGRGKHLSEFTHYWARPNSDFALVGIGSAYSIISAGAERFTQSAEAWKKLLDEAVIHNIEDAWGSGPALFGGFSFDPAHENSEIWENFPDGALVLPVLQLTACAEQRYLTINALVEADTEIASVLEEITHLFSQLTRPAPVAEQALPANLRLNELLPAKTWKNIVRETAADIARGVYRKVVLARAMQVEAEHDFEVTQVLRRLHASYPTAIVFAFNRGGKCFAGATPERLVRREADEVRTMALAGSIARGNTEEEDRELGEKLLNSSKDRQEHAVVIDTIREAFSKVCAEVSAEEEPQLLKLRNVQHLYTPVTGRLTGNNDILQLVGQLHPTPAVGGFPRQAAVDAIREREQLDRGWYASPVGWLNRRGEGEFAVALRSALLHGNKATLFAGCGIMGDSNPESEYAESNLKMRVMLSALSEI